MRTRGEYNYPICGVAYLLVSAYAVSAAPALSRPVQFTVQLQPEQASVMKRGVQIVDSKMPRSIVQMVTPGPIGSAPPIDHQLEQSASAPSQQSEVPPPVPSAPFRQPDAPPPASDIAAFMRGEYASQPNKIKALADQGFAMAQHDLGVFYERGTGVAQDYALAVSWYRKAADQGLARSQNMSLRRVFGSRSSGWASWIWPGSVGGAGGRSAMLMCSPSTRRQSSPPSPALER